MSQAPVQIRILPEKLEPACIPLPRVWVGFVLASLCLLLDICCWTEDGDTSDGFFVLGIAVGVVAWIYWLFCIHRLHQVLARATRHSYPISPRRAAGFLLLPFFSWYWRFRMCNQIAEFVNTHSTLRMKKGWAGAFLLAGSLLGTLALFAYCTSLHWFVLFGVAHHLTRKIRHTVKFREALTVARQKQLNLAMTSGLGAAFAFVLCRGIYEFYRQPRMEQVKDGIAILLLSLAVILFIEPLSERLRIALGLEEHHTEAHKRKTWMVRAFLTAILILSSFFHDVLHGQFLKLNDNWQVLFAGLLISGGVTYFWIAGVRQEPSRAAWFGVLSGAMLALFVSLTMGIAIEESQPGQQGADQNVSQPLEMEAMALSATNVPIGSRNLHFPPIPYGRLTTAWPWALFGLAGGLIIDRRWGRRGTHGVVIAIVATAVVCEALLLTLVTGVSVMTAVADLSAVIGWCIGLLLHPSAADVFGQRGAALAVDHH